MTEYNVYIISLDKLAEKYLYTTLAENPGAVTSDIANSDFYNSTDFYRSVGFDKNAAGPDRVAYRVIETEKDDRSRDDLIFDYIIEGDDSTSTAGSE